MNRPANLLLALALLATSPALAELRRGPDGTWALAEGRPTDLPADPAERAEILAALNRAQAALDSGRNGEAIGEADDAVDPAEESEAAAQARLIRARARAERRQFEDALADLRWLTSRRIDFPELDAAVDLQLALARRLASGESRRLGGWMPWFADRALALEAYQDALRAAPRGRRSDTALVEHARLALQLERPEDALESLERLVGEHPDSPHLPEVLARLAELRAADSPGPHWDQASAREALLALENLVSQYPSSPEAAAAPARIRELRNQMAASRLRLAEFYWQRRNNPAAARLMAASAITLAPDSDSAKDAGALIARIDAGEEAPATLADRVLGRYPRRAAAAKPSEAAPAAPAFREEPPRAAGER
ncbi:MAG: outer membrane protein assembly factor BamD [Opitutia bacterium]|jgi:outer membrane protein assembly factor BamD